MKAAQIRSDYATPDVNVKKRTYVTDGVSFFQNLTKNLSKTKIIQFSFKIKLIKYKLNGMQEKVLA